MFHIHLRPPIPSTRRGLKLWVLAIMIGVKGAGYARGETSSSTETSLRLITERLHIPLTVFGLLMLTLCLFAAATAYSHHGRDRWGYMALVGFAFSWSACFAVGPLLLDAPLYAWQGALNAAIFGGFLLMCAADPDSGEDA